MSKYTTEVRFICENLAGYTESKGGSHVDEIIDESWDKIFENFPIFEEEYRETLCKKILKHYYTREIGFETVGLWKLKLNTKMNEIMPYYNDLYYSASLEYNPLEQIGYTRTVNDARTKANTKNNSSARQLAESDSSSGNEQTAATNGNTKYDLFSNTPQGGLTGVENGTYLTTAEKITNSGTNNSTTNTSNTRTRNNSENISRNETGNENNYGTLTEVINGKMGGESYSQLIVEYRKAVLNIDMMIINDLGDLFLNLW